MDEDWKKTFREVMMMLNFHCEECKHKTLHVKDDDSIICVNCKTEYNIILKKK